MKLIDVNNAYNDLKNAADRTSESIRRFGDAYWNFKARCDKNTVPTTNRRQKKGIT